MKFEWKCPRCGAGPNAHGKGECADRHSGTSGCSGFLCEMESCDALQGERPDHGETLANVCRSARCGHCEWSGAFPRKPKGLASWEKTALAAGWTMPEARAAELARAQ